MENRNAVMIADNNEESRETLADAISRSGDLQLAGQTGDGGEVVGLLEETGAQLLVLEMVLPNMDGLGVLRQHMPVVSLFQHGRQGGFVQAYVVFAQAAAPLQHGPFSAARKIRQHGQLVGSGAPLIGYGNVHMFPVNPFIKSS